MYIVNLYCGDLNKNYLSGNNDIETEVEVSVPTDHFYEGLGQLGSKPLLESASNENLEELFNRSECKIRTKVKSSMKTKLEEKLENIQIDETDLKALEEALAEDEEELVEYYRSLKFEEKIRKEA